MSRTNKGGARLRAITLFAGAAAIAAGVFAATRHQPLTPACDIVPTAIFEGKTVQVNCTGLAANTQYKMASNGDSLWSFSSPQTFMSNGFGTATLNLNTSASGTDASTNVVLQDNSGTPIVNSDSVAAYKLSFSGSGNSTATTVLGGDSARLYIEGMLASDSVTIRPVDTGEAANSAGWDLGTAGDGSLGSPYQFSSSSPYAKTLSANGSGVLGPIYFDSVNPGSDVTTKYQIVINGAVVGLSDAITIQHQ